MIDGTISDCEPSILGIEELVIDCFLTPGARPVMLADLVFKNFNPILAKIIDDEIRGRLFERELLLLYVENVFLKCLNVCSLHVYLSSSSSSV